MLTGTKLNEETKETSTFLEPREKEHNKRNQILGVPKVKAKAWKKNRIYRPVLLTVADL